MSVYLNTRVSLLAQQLLDNGSLDALLQLPDAELANALREHGMSGLAESLGSAWQEPTAPSLERRIIEQVLNETQILLRPLRDGPADFIRYWLSRFEISNIKTLLRGKTSGETPAALLSRLVSMEGFSRIDVQQLAHAECAKEILRLLERGPYAEVVRGARRAYEQSNDLFNLDAALDRGYYAGLIQRAQTLEHAAGDSFRRLMAGLVDRINLTWLLRYRFHYGLPPAQVYYLLLGAHYGLASTRLRELTTATSPAAVVAALPVEMRHALADTTDVHNMIAKLEQLDSLLLHAVLRQSSSALTRAFSYLILRERDLRAVRAILRGHHLGLSPTAMQHALHAELDAAQREVA